MSDSSFSHQADGLKEGDYIVAVGETDCKWLGVTEVMRLLKDVDEEEVGIQVVSMMDSSPSMVGQPSPSCLLQQTFEFPGRLLSLLGSTLGALACISSVS